MNSFRHTTVKNTMLIYVHSFRRCQPLLFGWVPKNVCSLCWKKGRKLMVKGFTNICIHCHSAHFGRFRYYIKPRRSVIGWRVYMFRDWLEGGSSLSLYINNNYIVVFYFIHHDKSFTNICIHCHSAHFGRFRYYIKPRRLYHVFGHCNYFYKIRFELARSWRQMYNICIFTTIIGI
jgi:hypothetical protein